MFAILSIETATARFYTGHGKGPKPTNTVMKVAAGCDPPTSQIDIEINNVRAKTLKRWRYVVGYFWLDNARYEIPKVDAR